jgi:3D (Asp-Asp-Asp) domain-containing protein
MVDDDGQQQTLMTLSTTVEHILTDAGITLNEDDVVTSSFAGSRQCIDIERAFDVNILADNGDTTVVRMTAGTVADALELAGISLDVYDVTNAADDQNLTDDAVICVEKMQFTDRVVTESIDYQSVTRYSDSIAAGATTVTQQGVKGEKRYIYRDYICNGQVTHTQLMSEQLTMQPVDEIITVGTGAMSPLPEGIELDENGVPQNYKSVVTGVACAYTTPESNRGITSTGTVPCVGTVAVDPKVIPYGSKLYIVSDNGYVYGYGIASDTGGDLLNGNITADLYMNTRKDCYAFGRRTVKIYILG